MCCHVNSISFQIVVIHIPRLERLKANHKSKDFSECSTWLQDFKRRFCPDYNSFDAGLSDYNKGVPKSKRRNAPCILYMVHLLLPLSAPALRYGTSRLLGPRALLIIDGGLTPFQPHGCADDGPLIPKM
jgi:hypothetical protein